jgi:hypothetical protein
MWLFAKTMIQGSWWEGEDDTELRDSVKDMSYPSGIQNTLLTIKSAYPFA